MSDDAALRAQARALIEKAKAKGVMLATAESCTGGLIAGYLTAIAGSSAVLERGYVTYSNDAKVELLGVPAAIVAAYGAVSEQTVRAMAEGCLARSRADVSVAVTGIAGPTGGSADKPVGLVHLATAARDGAIVHVEQRFGALGRDEVRLATVAVALTMLDDALG
jgi:nicotinamide-nucleotide amidase